MSDGILLGRRHPGLLLEEAVDRAREGRGGLVLVTGEPGIGKTALLKDAGVRAQRHGATVLFGACWDGDGAPGYWPWIQVLRAARSHVTDERWEQCTEGRLAALAPLLGRDEDRPTRTGGVESVFDLHDAVTNLLVSCAEDNEVVIVLDDIHWADPASIRLLDFFVVRHTALTRLVTIAAYRDADVASADHPVGSLLADIAPKAVTVPLAGLEVDAIATLLARRGQRDLPCELIADVHRRTGGNPFFVEQTAQLWNAGGGVTAIPPGAAAAVERRLARLDAATADLLATAALLGNEVEPALLVTVTDLDPVAVDRALTTATHARLLAWRDDDKTLHFVHDLVRETLCRSLPPTERGRRHAAIVARDRETVTPRIRGTLRKLDTAHAALAAHLRDSVSTGASCSYRPRDDITWRL